MAASKEPARQRVGRVSWYEHHGGYYTYHRAGGRAVRERVGANPALAEFRASLLNAHLVAIEAKLSPDDVRSALILEGRAVIPGVADEATVGEGPCVDLPELRQRFLDHHEHVLRSAMGTVDRYRTATQHLMAYAAKVGITDPRQLDVAALAQHLRTVQVAPNGHAKAKRRCLRDKGVQYILECCRSMYRFGMTHRHLPAQTVNPFQSFGVARLRVRDAKAVFVFSAAQELAFLNAAPDWAFPIHFTLAKTGLRPGELVHLLIEDLDLDGGWLQVRGKPELGWTVKTGRERRVPLVDELITLLKEVLGARGVGPVFLRPQFRPTSPSSRADLARLAEQRLAVLAQALGRAPSRAQAAACLRCIWREAGAVKTDRIRQSFIRIARSVGLDATAPKSWRHTFATLLQEANVDLLVRQETLGHKPAAADQSALGMTGVYTHTSPAFQRAEIQRALCQRKESLALVHERVRETAARRPAENRHHYKSDRTSDKEILQ